MRRSIVALAFAIALAFGGSTAAHADDAYPAPPPTEPTLAGSLVAGECVRDAPWITFDVVLDDPDDIATSHTARLVLTDGVNSETIVLGDLVDNRLSGRILWPGASVDASGAANGWPGWELVDGEWVETTGNFAWTRAGITARIEVNPEIDVPLAYPPATPVCAAQPPTVGVPTSGGLVDTGSDIPVGMIGLGAALLALAGAGLVLIRPRRARR